MISTPNFDQVCLSRILPDLSALTWRLFANDFAPGRGSVVSDFEEPTWDGYAPIVGVTFASPVQRGSGNVIAIADTLTWVRTAGTGDDQVYGWWATSPDGLLALAERRAAGPWPMFERGAAFRVALRIPFGDLP